jgi:hypothetical protein
MKTPGSALISPLRLSEFDVLKLKPPHRKLGFAAESIRAARAQQIYAH